MGNQVLLEFNYIYRWHPVISKAETKWIDDRFKMILGVDYSKPEEKVSFIP